MSVLLLGDATTTYATADQTSVGREEGFQFVAKKTGVIEELQFRTNGTANTGITSLILGIAADSAGKPGAILGQGTAAGEPAASTWIKVTGLSINVTAGTTYWLISLPQGTAGKQVHYNAANAAGGNVESKASGLTKIEPETEWETFNEGPIGFQALGTEAPTVTKPADQESTQGSAASLQIEAEGATEYKAAGLPAGLAINPATGKITGTPSTAEETTVTITVKGAGGEATTTFKWRIKGLVVAVAQSTPSLGGTTDVTVRLQALDGTWETCGADRAIKVIPESETHVHDGWGPKTAGFTLKRSVISLWPDLGAFTPVEIEIGGVIVWDGRIAETPTKGTWEINVQCEGWQAHLDDDVYQRVYIHSKLTDWKDARSFSESNLAAFQAAPQIQAQQGSIVISFPNGSAVIQNVTTAGVILDLGPGGAAKRVLMNPAASTFALGTYTCKIRGANSIPALLPEGGGETLTEFDPSGASGTVAGTFATTFRYVVIYIARTGVSLTEAADRTLKITAISVFADTAYEAGNTSVLTGDVIGKDALERGTLLLSSDFSQIAKVTFHIPDFVLSKASTPREVWEAANAYYNYITKLLTGRRFSFQPRPTAPQLEIGAWSQADTEDTSANSGAEIYNRALIEATGQDGSALSVERSAAQQPGVLYLSPEGVPENPSFATNTEHWAASGGGAITRVTGAGEFHSAPAAGKWVPTKSGQTLIETFSGTFHKGVAYRLSFYTKQLVAGGKFGVSFGVAADHAHITLEPTEGAFGLTTITWTPTANRTGVTLEFFASFGTGLIVDDVSVLAAEPTLVDRRLFRRTKVIQTSSAITATEGQQLGDIFLQSHMTTPFKGSVSSLRMGSIRRVIGGQLVHPSQLGLYTQQLVRLSDRIDPDTGGLGRDGTLAEVSYEHKTQAATPTLDDKRGNFEALLQRLAAVQTPGS